MSDVAEKWGVEVAERGFAQVPNYLLLINQFLDKDHQLAPAELLILIQLVGSWWKRDEMPFPSMSTLAKRCGVSSRQVQRAMNSLEAARLVQRVNRRTRGIISSNAYDLTPLVGLLQEIARHFPNQFPRSVDQATVAAISARLAAKPEAAKADDDFADVFEDETVGAEAVVKLVEQPRRKKRRKPRPMG